MSIEPRKALAKLKPYLPGKSKKEIEEQTGRSDILRASFNETPLGPSPRALRAIREFLPDIHLYPEGSYKSLRAKLAKLWGREAENFIIGDGTDEVITLLAQTFVNPGDEVIIGEPTFGAYRLGVAIQGGVIVPAPLLKFQYDLEVFLNAVSGRTRLLYLCNPNNPTGAYIDKKSLEAFLNRLPGHVLVVLDEAYADYAEAEDFPPGNDYLDRYNIIVLRTFSKMYGLAGLRIGYGLANRGIIYNLNRVREPFNVNQLAAVAAEAVLDDSEYLELSRQTNRQGKTYLYRRLTEMGLNFSATEANFIWLEIGADSKQLVADMLAEGITVRGGYAFNNPEWIRYTISRQEENERFVRTLEIVLSRYKAASRT